MILWSRRPLRVARVKLSEQSWTQVDPQSHLLVPLGSTEQHGPHLPMDTDTRIAIAIAERAAEQTGATAAPALAYGSSGEHQGFDGTLSIGTEVLHAVVVELVRSATQTFDGVTFVNGHGGNQQAVTGAVSQMVAEGHSVGSWSPSIPGGDAHAGHTETSLMLVLAPSLVRLDDAEAGNTAPVRELMEDLRRSGVASVSPNGVLGDPTNASAIEGERLLADLVDNLVHVLRSR